MKIKMNLMMLTCSRVHVHRKREFDADDHRYLRVEHLDYTRIPDHWSIHTFQNLFSAIRDLVNNKFTNKNIMKTF